MQRHTFLKVAALSGLLGSPTGNVARLRQIFFDMGFSMDQPHIELQVSIQGKVLNRMAEAMWLTFNLQGVIPAKWQVEEINHMVSATDGSQLNFSSQDPDLAKGAHVKLSTAPAVQNYPQWCCGDWLYRFQMFA